MGKQVLPQSLSEIQGMACIPYEEARDMIRTGDLLFCSGAKPLSRIIQTTTRSPYSHVALVVRMLSIDRVLLLEAEWPYGVRVVPLSSYFKDWNGCGKPYSGNLLVARHTGLDADNPDTLALFLSELVDILGRPYSLRRALRIGLREIVALAGLRFRELRLKKATVCSEYIHHAYSRLGIHIPCNSKGYILPMDIASHHDVSLICRIR